jgi:hypothetical protein
MTLGRVQTARATIDPGAGRNRVVEVISAAVIGFVVEVTSHKAEVLVPNVRERTAASAADVVPAAGLEPAFRVAKPNVYAWPVAENYHHPCSPNASMEAERGGSAHHSFIW